MARDREKDLYRERGANLVEMALILPLLLLLLAAIADFGRAFQSYIVITNAAREGARLATRLPQNSSTDNLIRSAVIQEAANSGLDLTDPNHTTIPIPIDPPLAEREAGKAITVTVEYTVTTFFGGLIGLDEIGMRSRTAMVLFNLKE